MDENVKNIEDITKIEKSAEDKVEKLEKKIKLPQEKKKKIKSVNHVLQPLDPLPLLEYDQLHLREELVKFLGEWSYQLVGNPDSQWDPLYRYQTKLLRVPW